MTSAKGSGDRVREAFEPIHDGNEHVLQPSLLELVHHRQPELCPLVLGYPKAQNLAACVASDAQGHVSCLIFDRAAAGIADLYPECVEDHDGVHPIQSPNLPFSDVIADATDQIWGDLHAVDLYKMCADVTNAETSSVEPDDLVIHPVDPRLAFLDQLRLETVNSR